MNKSFKIETGSKVAIIGGGPAGSCFALYLLRYAKEIGVHPEITVYEARDFDELGPKGCKGCAGIVTMSALRNLQKLGLTIPDNVVQGKIEKYTVHSPFASISLSNPERGIQISSIYRGGGPRISHYDTPISFNGWLLRNAQEQGAKVVKQTVTGIRAGGELGIKVAEKSWNTTLLSWQRVQEQNLFQSWGLTIFLPKPGLWRSMNFILGLIKLSHALGTGHMHS